MMRTILRRTSGMPESLGAFQGGMKCAACLVAHCPELLRNQLDHLL